MFYFFHVLIIYSSWANSISKPSISLERISWQTNRLFGLTFKAYQLSTGQYHEIDQRLSFTHDMTLGDGFDPVVMNLAAEPTEFSIGNPYPNPFNPVVNFDVEITNESYVTAKIYNISGQEVATIHDGMLSAKNHQMRWMADSYASGVYFIKVVIDNNPATHKKIVLLK